jgi:hypothetical protein
MKQSKKRRMNNTIQQMTQSYQEFCNQYEKIHFKLVD